MIPGLDEGVQSFSGTLGSHRLPMANQTVARGDFPLLYSTLNQQLCSSNCVVIRQLTFKLTKDTIDKNLKKIYIHLKLTNKVSQEVNALAVAVVAWRVGADCVPASALVDVSVAADQEAVADVRPAVGVHVVVLDVAHHRGTVVGGAAGAASTVVDHSVGHRDGVIVGVGRRSGAPLPTSYDVWTRLQIL